MSFFRTGRKGKVHLQLAFFLLGTICILVNIIQSTLELPIHPAALDLPPRLATSVAPPNLKWTGPRVPPIDYNYSFLHYPDARTRFPLPDWLDRFLQTQPVGAQAQTLTEPNATFLVLACYKYGGHQSEECGGLADRLVQLPYLLWLAHKTHRKLLIKYHKPRPLEEFLVPPQHHGFDWRMPDGFFQDEWWAYGNRTKQQYRIDRWRVWHNVIESQPYASQKIIFVNNNMALPSVRHQMDELVGTPLQQLWPGIFRRMFQPSKGVAAEMAHLGHYFLKPGDYAAVHLRVRWPGGFGGQIQYNKLDRWADKRGGGLNMTDANTSRAVALLGDHAMDCAARIMPHARWVYVASDSNEVVEYLKYRSPQWADNRTESITQVHWDGASGNNTGRDPMQHGWGVLPWKASSHAKIITRPNPDVEPLHFDGFKWKTAEGGYATFIDLWMMAHAGCHSHGVGGFGRFASVLSGNRDSCSTRHRDYDSLSPSCATPAERKKWKAKQESKNVAKRS